MTSCIHRVLVTALLLAGCARTDGSAGAEVATSAALAELRQPANVADHTGDAVGAAVAPTDSRVFTDIFGRSVSAEIISLGEEEIVLRRQADGVAFTVPLDRLSDDDRAFVEVHRTAIVKALTPLPETAFTRALREDFRVLKQSGLALEPVPVEMWRKTRYFVVVYGMADSPEATTGALKHMGEDIVRTLTGRPVAVLWLGPSNSNGVKPPPIPEGDLKVAKVLPAGVAIVGVEAVARDGARVDAEIAAIAREESPADPRLFLASHRGRHEAVRAVWRKRILSRIAVYWPGCVYRWSFDPGSGLATTRSVIVDRNGKPVAGPDGAPLEGRPAAMIAAAATLTAEDK